VREDHAELIIELMQKLLRARCHYAHET
jgi:hypothetical protein